MIHTQAATCFRPVSGFSNRVHLVLPQPSSPLTREALTPSVPDDLDPESCKSSHCLRFSILVGPRLGKRLSPRPTPCGPPPFYRGSIPEPLPHLARQIMNRQHSYLVCFQPMNCLGPHLCVSYLSTTDSVVLDLRFRRTSRHAPDLRSSIPSPTNRIPILDEPV